MFAHFKDEALRWEASLGGQSHFKGANQITQGSPLEFCGARDGDIFRQQTGEELVFLRYNCREGTAGGQRRQPSGVGGGVRTKVLLLFVP